MTPLWLRRFYDRLLGTTSSYRGSIGTVSEDESTTQQRPGLRMGLRRGTDWEWEKDRSDRFMCLTHNYLINTFVSIRRCSRECMRIAESGHPYDLAWIPGKRGCR